MHSRAVLLTEVEQQPAARGAATIPWQPAWAIMSERHSVVCPTGKVATNAAFLTARIAPLEARASVEHAVLLLLFGCCKALMM